MSEKLSRRDFLEISAASLLAIWLGWGGAEWLIDQLSGLGYEGGEFNPIPEGRKLIGQHDHVWVWTHAYYGLIHGTSYSNDPDFPKYLASLPRLKEKLEKTNELVIGWEEKAFFRQEEYLANYCPPEGSLRVATRPAMGDMANYVKTPGGVLRQNPGKIFDILKTSGVKEAWFVGSEPGGCVSNAADYFVKHDIAIRGVKGLLFPPDDQRQRVNFLYQNAVDPNEYFGLPILSQSSRDSGVS